ncbi:hypothetical protein ElyMa_002005100 [Elysia marginata]|uniref:Uncharacterized protein n=1 Tax=Elysia marginata TaxID=1093978 RepID=A0AAV4F357_9GAST|nr:hypothetical protein ElyMa_002005100 [Elysia marginata]
MDTRHQKLPNWRRLSFVVLSILFSVAVLSAKASPRNRVKNLKSELQMRIREKQVLEDIKRRVKQTNNAKILAAASKVLRSQHELPKHVTSFAKQISQSEENHALMSSPSIIEETIPQRGSTSGLRSSPIFMIEALSANCKSCKLPRSSHNEVKCVNLNDAIFLSNS